MRLDATGATVYITRSEGGIHNLHALSLVSGGLRRVTNNEIYGVTFSDIVSSASSPILGIRHQRTSDIWLLDSTPSRLRQPVR